MKKYIISILFLIFITCIFFYQSILFGKLPVPSDSLVGMYHPYRDLYSSESPRGIPYKNPLITDPIRQQIPWRKLVIDAWKQGKIPLWNPYELSGVSLIGNIQAAPFYIFNILFFIFNFEIAWTLLIVLQPLLGSVFMYMYLKNIKLSHVASIIGGIVFGYSGFMMSWLTWGTIGHVILWTPLIFLSIDKIFSMVEFKNVDKNTNIQINNSNKTYRLQKIHPKVFVLFWMILLSFSIINSFFAGHSQIFIYVLIISLCYGIFRFFSLSKNSTKVMACVILIICGIFVLSITSIQWRPLLTNLSQSSRFIESVDWQKEGWFLPFEHLIQFLAPDFFGNPATGNYWGKWNYGEFFGYIGMLPFIFVLYVVFSIIYLIVLRIKLLHKHIIFNFEIELKQIQLHRDSFFWVISTILCLVFILPTPVATIPFLYKIPLFSTLQPTRLLSIIVLSLSILSAFGFDALTKINYRKILPLFLSTVGLICMLWIIVQYPTLFHLSIPQESLSVSRHNLVIPTVLIICSFVLLIFYQYIKSLHKFVPFKFLFYFAFVLIILVDLFRSGWKFIPFTGQNYFFPETKIITYLKKQPKPYRVMSLDDRILPPNVTSYFGIESIDGYDPVTPFSYEQYAASNERGEANIDPPFGFNRIVRMKNIISPLWKLLNVKYILTMSELKSSEFTEILQEGETRLYEYKDAYPRVYLADDVIQVQSTKEVYSILYNPMYANKKIAVVYNNTQINNQFTKNDEIQIKKYNEKEIIIDTQTSGERVAVLLNRFDPTVHILYDGLNINPIIVNAIMTGFIVRSGIHTITISL
jgi:hypothetical protein